MFLINKKVVISGVLVFFVAALGFWGFKMDIFPKGEDFSAVIENHFHPKGKLPSVQTVALLEQYRKSLAFEDEKDFSEAKKGFIAAPKERHILTEDGTIVWNIGHYDFLLEGKDFDSVHPSLQRQAILNMGYGLFEVVEDKIYQVRGFDLANIVFIRGDTGWIIMDPLTTKETASAAKKLVEKELNDGKLLDVKAVIISHSHGDHYGGIQGVISKEDVISGKVQVITGQDFTKHVASEAVYAGHAMSRRLMYQYGTLLQKSPFGHVDQALGKDIARGTHTLIEPNVILSQDIETLVIDGVEMVFHNTPGTEAPVEMNTYFPQWKAFWSAENITGTIHNIYTLRGALIRDPLLWSKKINEALYLFGNDVEVMFSAHNWPRWGGARVRDIMRTHRDVYAHLNNHVLFLANQGVTINEIHNVYQVPPSLHKKWAARSYHGSPQHNSRGVLNRYLGYWDGNPATLIPLSPKDSAPLYVEMMGGAQSILQKSNELYGQGKYFLAMEILNKLVYAQPDNQVARDLLGDVFEQIGYQQESTGLRNSFLAGAYELRSEISDLPPQSASPDVLSAMPADVCLDALAVRIDSTVAQGLNFIINLKIKDRAHDGDHKFVVELNHGVLTYIEGFESKEADLKLKIELEDLQLALNTFERFDEKIKTGEIEAEGNLEVYEHLKRSLVKFEKMFEMLPGTISGVSPSRQ